MIQIHAERIKKNKTMEQVFADVIAEIDKKLDQENALLLESNRTPQKSN
jgi:hypothetical protein